MAKEYSKTCGSELERLKDLGDYDIIEFNKLYKVCTPLIKRLSSNIDNRRLNVTPDIIKSYFWDKFLYIYGKYHNQYEYEQLKASLLVGLKKYSYKLMREGYSRKAEFNQTLVSFEDLFDDSKEDVIDEPSDGDNHLQLLNEFMRVRLTSDEFIIYQIILDPPPFIKIRMEDQSKGKLSILHIIDFFEFPRTRRVYQYLNNMKTRVLLTLKEAKLEMGKS